MDCTELNKSVPTERDPLTTEFHGIGINLWVRFCQCEWTIILQKYNENAFLSFKIAAWILSKLCIQIWMEEWLQFVLLSSFTINLLNFMLSKKSTCVQKNLVVLLFQILKLLLPSTMTSISPESSPNSFFNAILYFPVSPLSETGTCNLATSSLFSNWAYNNYQTFIYLSCGVYIIWFVFLDDNIKQWLYSP